MTLPLPRDALRLQFASWPPPEATQRMYRYPIGTVRISSRGKRSQPCRNIKVRNDGPTAGRWIALSRFWWLKNKGAIPAGWLVGHLDGNPLNDDPHNYALMVKGDSLAIFAENHPKRSAAAYRKAAKATAALNRQRGEFLRATRILRRRWYAVDFAARQFVGVPHRKPTAIYAEYGYDVGACNGGGARYGAVLGYPSLPCSSAAMVTALLTGSAIGGLELMERTNAVLRHWGFRTICHRAVGQTIEPLSAAGYVLSARGRGYGNLRRYVSTPAARAERLTVCPIVAVQGRELAGERFAGFVRVAVRAKEAA